MIDISAEVQQGKTLAACFREKSFLFPPLFSQPFPSSILEIILWAALEDSDIKGKSFFNPFIIVFSWPALNSNVELAT
jgi:hypothetical protein